jgi:hypothetical protein
VPLHRIERAHCIELGRVVGIDEARQAFTEGTDFTAYHFECAEAACAGQGVRIAGVNYRFDAEVQPKLVSNHFRRLDDHDPICRYFSPAADNHTTAPSSGQRRARALRRDLVEEFLPPSLGAALPATQEHGPSAAECDQSSIKRRTRRDRIASTSSLARLIDTYRVLVSSQAPNALRDHVIRVRGVGAFPMAEYVTPVYRARRASYPHVIYGGARWAKAYGQGFKLRFFDRIGGVPVFLYVSPPIAAGGRWWLSELAHVRAGGYVTVYALGYPQRARDYAVYTIEIRSMEHLVLRMPPAKRLPENPSGPPETASALVDQAEERDCGQDGS